jgi:hypothetical protein
MRLLVPSREASILAISFNGQSYGIRRTTYSTVVGTSVSRTKGGAAAPRQICDPAALTHAVKTSERK